MTQETQNNQEQDLAAVLSEVATKRSKIEGAKNLLARILRNAGVETPGGFEYEKPDEPIAVLAPSFKPEALKSFVSTLNRNQNSSEIYWSLRKMTPEGCEDLWLWTEIVTHAFKNSFGANNKVALEFVRLLVEEIALLRDSKQFLPHQLSVVLSQCDDEEEKTVEKSCETVRSPEDREAERQNKVNDAIEKAAERGEWKNGFPKLHDDYFYKSGEIVDTIQEKVNAFVAASSDEQIQARLSELSGVLLTAGDLRFRTLLDETLKKRLAARPKEEEQNEVPTLQE